MLALIVGIMVIQSTLLHLGSPLTHLIRRLARKSHCEGQVQCIKRRFKEWKCLQERWRHPVDKHAVAFHAGVNIEQIALPSRGYFLDLPVALISMPQLELQNVLIRHNMIFLRDQYIDNATLLFFPGAARYERQSCYLVWLHHNTAARAAKYSKKMEVGPIQVTAVYVIITFKVMAPLWVADFCHLWMTVPMPYHRLLRPLKSFRADQCF